MEMEMGLVRLVVAAPSRRPLPPTLLPLTLGQDSAMARAFARRACYPAQAPHRHHVWDGAGAWTSRHARRDREMRLVRLVVTAPPSRRPLPPTATPNPKSGFGDGKGARERAIRHRHEAGTTWDGAGAWTSRHALRDREMRLVRLVVTAAPSRRPLPPTANPNPKSGFGDGKGACKRAIRHRHHTGTTCDGAGAWTSRHARRDREIRLVRLVVALRRPDPAALPLRCVRGRGSAER